MNPTGLPPLQLAASGGDASAQNQINPVSTYNAAFNVGGGAASEWLPWAALAVLAVILWRK